MAKTIKEQAATPRNADETEVIFFGKAWKNTVTNEDSEYFNQKYFNGKVDRDVEMYLKVPIRDENKKIVSFRTILVDNALDSIQMWKNNKRTDDDADLRISLRAVKEVPTKTAKKAKKAEPEEGAAEDDTLEGI